MEDKTLEGLKSDLNGEAQAIKDMLIDDLVRRLQQFQQQWNNINAKQAKLNEIQQQQDKINK